MEAGEEVSEFSTMRGCVFQAIRIVDVVRAILDVRV